MKTNEIKHLLKNEFEMEDYSILNYYLGIKIEHNIDKAELKMSQGQHFKHFLLRFNMLDCKSKFVSIEAKLYLSRDTHSTAYDQPYKQLIGCLMYAMLATRPDLSYCLNYFSNFQSTHKKVNWMYLKNILKYIKETLDYSIIDRKQSYHVRILEEFINAY